MARAMTKLNLRLVKGHLIVEVDGQVALIDTGSPVTIGRTRSLKLGSVRYPTLPNQGIGFGTSDFLGYLADWLQLPQLDYLIGTDVLRNYRVRVDVPGGKLSLLESTTEPGTALELVGGHAYPQVDTGVGNAQRQALFDTGAWLSYVPQDLVRDLAPLDSVTDFLPGYGEFTTPVYMVPVRVGDSETRVVRAGVLPAGPFSFIVGTELLLDRTVEFDFPAERLRWVPRAA